MLLLAAAVLVLGAAAGTAPKLQMAADAQCTLQRGSQTVSLNGIPPAQLRIPQKVPANPSMDMNQDWAINLCTPAVNSLCPSEGAAFVTEIGPQDNPTCEQSFTVASSPRYGFDAAGNINGVFRTATSAAGPMRLNLTLVCGDTLELRAAQPHVIATQTSGYGWNFDMVLETRAACSKNPCIFPAVNNSNSSDAQIDFTDVPPAVLPAQLIGGSRSLGLRAFAVSLCTKTSSAVCRGDSYVSILDGDCKTTFPVMANPWSTASNWSHNGTNAAATFATADGRARFTISVLCGTSKTLSLVGNSVTRIVDSSQRELYWMTVRSSAVCSPVPTPPAPTSVPCSVTSPSGAIYELWRVPQSRTGVTVYGADTTHRGYRTLDVSVCQPFAYTQSNGESARTYVVMGKEDGSDKVSFPLAARAGWTWNATAAMPQVMFSTSTQNEQIRLLLQCGSTPGLVAQSATVQKEDGEFAPVWVYTIVASVQFACADGQHPTTGSQSSSPWKWSRVRCLGLVLILVGATLMAYVYMRRRAAAYQPLRPIVPHSQEEVIPVAKGSVQAPSYF